MTTSPFMGFTNTTSADLGEGFTVGAGVAADDGEAIGGAEGFGDTRGDTTGGITVTAATGTSPSSSLGEGAGDAGNVGTAGRFAISLFVGWSM
ncbi:hypothetical protein FACS1894202_05160 [Clostridia bacterium]|nr:hypothetical protein FACS1894202_05160 [Clostridia bacterium]